MKHILSWLALWLGLAFITNFLSQASIRYMLAPYSFKDQIYNFGSDYLSFKIIVYALTHITIHPFVYHLLFSLPVIICAIGLFILIKQKYSHRLAVASVALFISQTYILQAVHTFDFSILSLMSLPIIVLLTSWLHPKHSLLLFALFGIILAVSLSIPFFWIYFLFGLILARKRCATLFSNATKQKRFFLAVPIVAAVIAQSIYSLKTGSFDWAIGNVDKLSLSYRNIVRTLENIFLDVNVGDEYTFPLILNGLALLAVLSIYVYYQGFHENQAKVIGLMLMMSVLFTATGLVNGFYIIITGLLIMVANGIAFMLQQWFTVFPKNPIAKFFGLCFVFSFIALCCYVQLAAYYDLSAL